MSNRFLITVTCPALMMVALASGCGPSLDNQMEATIKKSLLDPESYEHVKTDFVPATDPVLVGCFYDGPNVQSTSDEFAAKYKDGKVGRVRFRAESRGGSENLTDLYFLIDKEQNIVEFDDFDPNNYDKDGLDAARIQRNTTCKRAKFYFETDLESSSK